MTDEVEHLFLCLFTICIILFGEEWVQRVVVAMVTLSEPQPSNRGLKNYFVFTVGIVSPDGSNS